MRITSLEIKQHEFEKSFRGYNVDEVNHFLSNLADEWDRMLNEIKMLKMQLDIAEKDASKLREVEMTLIKTLRTAEDTSTKIKESATLEASRTIEEANLQASKTIDEANQEASRKIRDANFKVDQLIKDAENASRQMVSEAETKVKGIHEAAEIEVADLDLKYNNLETRKNVLLNQLKSYNVELSQLIDNNEGNIGVKKDAIIKEEPKIETPKVEKNIDFFEETKPVEEVKEEIEEVEEAEDFVSGISYSSAVNKIVAETEVEDNGDLERIEGIGPKIKEVLNNAGIKTFRDLATTPEYRLKDILVAAGSHFVAHDPGTWNEQALLAANGEWDKLDALKDTLIAGREPKVEDTTEVDGSNTEEMLEKINKVKAAIRKAMVEKTESETPKPDTQTQSGSFFDSI